MKLLQQVSERVQINQDIRPFSEWFYRDENAFKYYKAMAHLAADLGLASTALREDIFTIKTDGEVTRQKAVEIARKIGKNLPMLLVKKHDEFMKSLSH